MVKQSQPACYSDAMLRQQNLSNIKKNIAHVFVPTHNAPGAYKLLPFIHLNFSDLKTP